MALRDTDFLDAPIVYVGYTERDGIKYPGIQLWTIDTVDVSLDQMLNQRTKLQQFADGFWIGNPHYSMDTSDGTFEPTQDSNGIFINHETGSVYCVRGKSRQKIYTGDAVAMFG